MVNKLVKVEGHISDKSSLVRINGVLSFKLELGLKRVKKFKNKL